MRFQVYVTEGHDAFDRLLKDLSAPPSLGSGVVTFASFKAKFFEHSHQIDEVLARRPKCVMVMVSPAEAKLVLPLFLDLGSTIAALPIGTFFFKHQGARKIASDLFQHFIKDSVCLLESFCITY